MTTIDARLEGLMHGPSALWIILLVSLALGLRHATDPDHLAAVTSLIVSDGERGRVSKAGLMGLLWGLGHGTTVVLVGAGHPATLEVATRPLPRPQPRREPRSPARALPRIGWLPRARPQSFAAHALLFVRDRTSARHRRLGRPHAAPALDHLRQGASRYSAPALRDGNGPLDGAALECLRGRHSRRADREQLRAVSTGAGRTEHDLRGVVRLRSTRTGRVPPLIIGEDPWRLHVRSGSSTGADR
jgi:hypothetical protein